MATQNLSSLAFPEPFLTDRFTSNLLELIDRSLAAQPYMKLDLEAAQPHTKLHTTKLETCSHESAESRPGACDGGRPCLARGTIFDLATDLEYCAKHFAEAGRG